ncbi:glycoside hydrolase [Clostridium sartagoforme]|uniref:Glycoside hydrolase n=1 Tax=Clostridium sartagoforme TaxID=84031 RepID=A0A4S2DL65_9CLOT|nr:glycoside hydrolase [Clostridium sartagoforme]TGY42412.1 glycoside hydrolase [Clostridium sartagoforme]
MKSNEFSPKRKDRKKIIRGTLQGLILLVILIVIIKALFSFKEYNPFNIEEISTNSNDKGFITLSYFGVDRDGSDTLISTKDLEKQIKSLKDNGYVTITQEDILDYYNKGKKLPKKSLFLLFEDGRRDTAIFAQKILEKYNYKGTILTYSDKFEKEDPKFLMPKDLLKLKGSTYWELGTNGYRLEFINVFDRKEKFLGDLTSIEFSELQDTIDRDYNHYLMDYIRDEDSVPLESYDEMKARISSDYEKLSDIYNNELGGVPELYAIMHSNTGEFGTNNRVSDVNEEWINKLFAMNFNREGFSLNTKESSIYDLTRLQPQAYWSTNHLLMRLYDDTKEEFNFVIGDEEKSSDFEEVKGQMEFIDDKIILTSLPKETGLLKLKNSEGYNDVNTSVYLNGNVIGSQGIYLRSNDDLSNSLAVKLINDKIEVTETLGGNKEVIFSKELNTFGESLTFSNGAKVDIKEKGNKKLDIILSGDNLSINIDDETIVSNLEVKVLNKGSVYLESAFGEYGYSQRNIADDVYDGVFKELKITDINEEVLYDSTLNGFELIKYNVKNIFNKVINWFIKNL